MCWSFVSGILCMKRWINLCLSLHLAEGELSSFLCKPRWIPSVWCCHARAEGQDKTSSTKGQFTWKYKYISLLLLHGFLPGPVNSWSLHSSNSLDIHGNVMKFLLCSKMPYAIIYFFPPHPFPWISEHLVWCKVEADKAKKCRKWYQEW